MALGRTPQPVKETQLETSRSGSGNVQMRVFVFLAHGFGATTWLQRWNKGDIPGLNEKLPYGYYRAAGPTCHVEYSEDTLENRLTKFIRRCLRRLLGCDLVHAWRNRKALSDADIVWTHTELEHLAVLALWQCQRRKHRPKLIAHNVWLFDRWHEFSSARRWLYHHLMNHADVISVLSPDNLKMARKLFPNSRTELILFGTNTDTMTPVANRKAGNPVRLVSLGNDMHRDWDTLIAAAEQWHGYTVRIASQKLDRRMIRNVSNIEIIAATSREEISRLYSWADIVIVPLKHNLHVSGITVVCEAVLRGVPVVCTDTGGLRAYFSEQEIRYVPLNDASAMRRAIEELARDDKARIAMAERAQAHLLSAGLSSHSFARRHCEISEQLLRMSAASAGKSFVGDVVSE
jgi:glycosyltransferase involved in cell wall biosynthesis